MVNNVILFMDTPLFSIITVCYNAAGCIGRTLASVREQLFGDYEYIIIDGASTDGTTDIVTRSGVKCDRLVCEPDNGIYDAMNKGIGLARGEYLIFLNAGDTLFADDTLSKAAGMLKAGNPDVFYGDTAIVDDGGNFIAMRRLRPPKRLSSASFRMGMTVCHQAFWVKRSVAPLYDLAFKYSADYDWCVRILKRNPSPVCMNSGLTLVNYLQEGTTTKHHRASLKERFDIMCREYGTAATVVLHLWFAVRNAASKGSAMLLRRNAV